VMESLIKSGAMDGFGPRASLFAAVDKAMERAQKAQRDADSGQHGLFLSFSGDDPGAVASGEEPLPNAPEWDESTRLTAEKEILGFYVSGHPLERFADKLLDLNAKSCAEILEMTTGTGKEEITAGGLLIGLKVMKSKKGDLYANAKLEDMSGAVEAIIFPEAYKRLSEKLKMDVPVLVKGSVRVEEGAAPKIALSQISALDEMKVKLPKAIRIRVPLSDSSEGTIDALHLACTERSGEASVFFDLDRFGDFTVVMEPDGYNVQADREFIRRVEALCGRGAVRVIG